MKPSSTRLSALLGFMLFATAGVYAQRPAPTATPVEDVVKISTNLIRVDVTVTDQKGKAITDLRTDEVEIFENGEKQKITDLRFISAGVRRTEPRSDAARSGIPVPAAQLRPEQVRRTVALVVDDLNLSWESVARTRGALKKFVDEQMEDGDLVAIIRTGAGIGALQQFTSDKRILYAAIDKVKWNPLGNGGVSAFAPLDAVLPKDDQTEPEDGERSQEGIEREFRDFREGYFSTGTLGALEYVVKGMGMFAGRKSVVFFSDGFLLSNTGATGFLENSRSVDPMLRLIENANRASVVVYAMDPRGLVYTGLTAADNVSNRSMTEVDTEMAARRSTLSETQQSLRYIAEETGGFALVNNNDLTGGVRRVLEDQSYYLISYEPESDTFDPAKRRFNKLDVKVTRPGAKVRYRSGFFSVPDREPVAAPANTARAADPLGQLERALVSPFSVSGINVRLNALFGSDTRNPAYVRSLLHINAADLTFVDAEDGKKKAVFDVLAMSFGDNGQPVDQLGKTYTLTATPTTLKKLLAEGFVYHFMFPVKKAGPYQYRVAVRDTPSGRLGSASQFIEVPDVKKKRLTVSSIVLENLSAENWQAAIGANPVAYESNPMTDTALKRIKAGTVLRFGFEIYNARLDAARQPKLTARLRIFRDGALILDGKAVPVDTVGQTDLQHIKVARAVGLGRQITPGDYILQVVVTDAAEPKKEKVATQFVQFELVE